MCYEQGTLGDALADQCVARSGPRRRAAGGRSRWLIPEVERRRALRHIAEIRANLAALRPQSERRAS